MNVGSIMEFLQKFLNSATEKVGDGAAAYGGGMAGAAFDPLSFIKKPQVILRIISIVINPIPN